MTKLPVPIAILVVAPIVLAACADRPRGDSPEARFEREAAYRQACVAQVLARGAAEDLQVVEAALPTVAATDPATEFAQRASIAAFEFARAYQRHAELRASAYAYLDSAVNHAETSADSVRFIDRANSYSINMPVQGTVEGNVLERYQENLTTMLADADHQCNWDIPF